MYYAYLLGHGCVLVHTSCAVHEWICILKYNLPFGVGSIDRSFNANHSDWLALVSRLSRKLECSMTISACVGLDTTNAWLITTVQWKSMLVMKNLCCQKPEHKSYEDRRK